MGSSWDDAVAGPIVGPAEAGADTLITLGVAVGVPEPFATQLRTYRAGSGDPVAHAVPPHITIVPPVVVPAHALDSVVAHVRGAVAAVPRFGVRLSGSASFRPVSQVVFVRVADGAPQCGDLEELVRSGPLSRELGFPYHPHVTVAHDVAPESLDAVEAELAGYRADFDVAAVQVFACSGDGVWRAVAEAPLAGPGAGDT